MKSGCLLEDCLEEYTKLEILRDCICRKCSFSATHRRLVQEISSATDPPPTATAASAEGTASTSSAATKSKSSNLNSTKRRKKRVKEKERVLKVQGQMEDLKKMEALVRKAMDQRRIEEDLFYVPQGSSPGQGAEVKVEIDKVFSPVSTKQAMIARVCSLPNILHIL
jgi:ubiquitin carboxyl-terminal hydrolase 1